MQQPFLWRPCQRYYRLLLSCFPPMGACHELHSTRFALRELAWDTRHPLFHTLLPDALFNDGRLVGPFVAPSFESSSWSSLLCSLRDALKYVTSSAIR